MQIKTYLALACFAFFSVYTITAQTTTQYIGLPNGDWFEPLNWSHGLPSEGKEALIGGGASVVIGSPLTSNFTINNFGSLTFSASFVNDGAVFSLGNLSFAATADVTNNSSFTSLGNADFATGAHFTNETGASFVNGGTFTLPTTLMNKGNILNNGTLNAVDGMIQTQGTFENNQTMTVAFLTVAMGTSLANNYGANLNVTGNGAAFNINGLVNNFGTVTNAGSTIVNDIFNNNGLFKNLASGEVKINIGKTFDNSNGTLDNEGKFENYGTFINGYQFLNSNDARNFGQFQNNNLLSNLTGSKFRNETGAILSMGYGSQLLNAEDFENEGQLISHGLVQNDGEFENDGTMANIDGSVLDNNNKLTNNGTITAINIIRNDGIFTNKANISINAGAVFSNYAAVENASNGVFSNAQDIINKSESTFINDGTVNNQLRFTNEGFVENNATFNNAGDVFNRIDALFLNNGQLLLVAGNIRNEGALTNTSQLSVNDCSTIRNQGNLTNNGAFTIAGILFQTGTLTGNAPNVQGGYVHTSATSNAPSVCKNGSFGANIDGDVKVYASELIAFPNFEACNNMIYKANGLDRPVFNCSDIGSVLQVNVKLKTRINDSLTCVALVTPVDVLEPQFTTSCPGNVSKTTLGNSADATWTPPVAVDNCTATTLTGSKAPGSSFPIGSTTVTYTAKDAYNNTNNCAFTVTVAGLVSCTTNIGPANSASGVDPTSIQLTWSAASNATHYDVVLGITNPPTTIVKSNVFATTATVTGLSGGVTYRWYVVPKNDNGAATGCQSSVTSFTTKPPCVNVTNAGSITGAQIVCDGIDPTLIANSQLPTGGTGALEYVWQQAALDPSSNPNAWTTVAGANTPTYDPPVLSQSTWFRRGARRGNCSDFLFTTSVKIAVGDAEPPALFCKNLEIQLGEDGQATIDPASVFQSGSDNCSSVSLLSVVPNTFSCNELGTNTVTLKAGDSKGNTATCTAVVSVSLNQNTRFAYTILVQDDVHFHKNFIDGNIGVWKAGKEARIHDETTVTGFVRSPMIDLSGGSVVTGGHTAAQAPQPVIGLFKYNTMPDPPSDVKVPDNFAGVYLLNGSNFKKIEVGKNATVKFVASGIVYIKELITKDADAGKKTSVQFSGNTELVVRRKIELGKRTEINWGSQLRVKFYVEEDNALVRESCKVNASIDIRFKDINVDDGTEQNHTQFQGQFIAKKVDAKKWVDWAWSPYECSSLPPVAPIVFNDDLGLSVSQDMEEVQLNFVTNTDHKSLGYVVERSENGVDFEPLLELLPETDSEQLNLYKNRDTQPNFGTNFYRVRAKFEDGSEAVSPVRTVELQLDSEALTLFPNPTNRHVSVYFEKMVGRSATVTIHNSFGHKVFESNHDSLPDAPLRLDLDNLPEGMYWLWFKVDGLRDRSVRFMVVK